MERRQCITGQAAGPFVIHLLAILLVSCAPKLYTDTSTPRSLDLPYEPGAPLAQTSHYPISLAVKAEMESPRPGKTTTTPDDLSMRLGFAPHAELHEIIGNRVVEEIQSRGLISEVWNWHRGLEADYYLRIRLSDQQAVLMGSQDLASVWQVGRHSKKLQRDDRIASSPLRFSSSIEVTLFTDTNLPITTKQLVMVALHPDPTCGDYIWLGMRLREGAEGGDLPGKQRMLRLVEQIDGDRALSQARDCYVESYDLLVRETMTQVADFTLSAIESVQPSPDTQQEDSDVQNEKVTIIIASVPSGADVLVDELFIGQTPLRLSVSRGDAHSVQLSATGFEAMVKLIDPSSFGDKSVQHLLYRLKANGE
jgi:hypothetical protein